MTEQTIALIPDVEPEIAFVLDDPEALALVLCDMAYEHDLDTDELRRKVEAYDVERGGEITTTVKLTTNAGEEHTSTIIFEGEDVVGVTEDDLVSDAIVEYHEESPPVDSPEGWDTSVADFEVEYEGSINVQVTIDWRAS
jgi:hypothetical protein